MKRCIDLTTAGAREAQALASFLRGHGFAVSVRGLGKPLLSWDGSWSFATYEVSFY